MFVVQNVVVELIGVDQNEIRLFHALKLHRGVTWRTSWREGEREREREKERERRLRGQH